MLKTTLISSPILRHICVCATAGLLACGGSVLPALSQEAGSPSLTAVAIDTADDNRFFTRVGGTVRDDVTYQGLEPGQPYTLAAQLLNMSTQATEGDTEVVVFTPESAEGSVSIELPVPPNRTEFNIDYVVALTLYEGELDEGSLNTATPQLSLVTRQTLSRPSRCMPSRASP